jgi:hypothetical protein
MKVWLHSRLAKLESRTRVRTKKRMGGPYLLSDDYGGTTHAVLGNRMTTDRGLRLVYLRRGAGVGPNEAEGTAVYPITYDDRDS